MDGRPPFNQPDPTPSDPPQQAEDAVPEAIPPAACVPLTRDELTALLEFFLILDEWDTKEKMA